MTKPLNVLWAHDHRFIPLGSDVYSEVQFESPIWDRYLEHFDTVNVFARLGLMPDGKNADSLFRSSAPGVEFTLQPNIASLKGLLTSRGEVKKNFCKAVAKADAVIARLPSEIGLLAVSEARRAGKPYAIEAVGCPWDGMMNYGTLQGKFYAPILTARMRQAVKSAPYVTYVTQEFLQRRYPAETQNQIGVSDVELGALDNSVWEKRQHRLQQLAERPLVLGLIGSLTTKVKGIQHVLAALEAVKDELPPFEFRVLGGGDPGPWRDLAQRHGIAELVHFEGTLPSGEAVWEWLDAVDIYLQPSLKEGLPRALVEALSRGCPAIGSTVAGIPELLDPTSLVQPGAIDQLGATIRAMASDPAIMRQQAARNWEKAHEFERSLLFSKRSEFWRAFANAARPQSAADALV